MPHIALNRVKEQILERGWGDPMSQDRLLDRFLGTDETFFNAEIDIIIESLSLAEWKPFYPEEYPFVTKEKMHRFRAELFRGAGNKL